MPDTRWIDNIRKIVMCAIEEAVPCDAITGTVLTASPITVQVDQKLILRADQITLAKHVTDHEEQMGIPGVGTVSVSVKGALRTGDQVILLQKKGGQHYVIIDRL